MNILKHKDEVIKLLKSNPHLKDDDNKLIANIWYSQIKDKQYTAFEFLELFSEGKVANPQSIRRIRRKLQEEFPELRGKKWEKRHKEQKNVKEQLYTTPELYLGGTP